MDQEEGEVGGWEHHLDPAQEQPRGRDSLFTWPFCCAHHKSPYRAHALLRVQSRLRKCSYETNILKDDDGGGDADGDGDGDGRDSGRRAPCRLSTWAKGKAHKTEAQL